MKNQEINISEQETVSALFLSENERDLIAVDETHFQFSEERMENGIKYISLGISEMMEEPIQTLIKEEVPNMWSKNYIGLYCQYAAIGILNGSSGTCLPFCAYFYQATTSVCANSENIMFFPWSIKLFFALLVDCYRPFGMRRKPWMIGGWSMVLLLLFILACSADQMSVTTWLITLLFAEFFMMFSGVPSDGYSVELGRLESYEQRGQIFATGQRIRVTFSIVAGMIQAFLLNGPSTNDSDCPISMTQCWTFGFTINQYYALLFLLIFFLTIPTLWLKELDARNIPQRSFSQFFTDLWDTLQNLVVFYLIIFVIGQQSFSNFTNNANFSIQYYVIKLTNLQSGIDLMTTYAALATSVWIFQRFLMNWNWRWTQYGSTIGCALLGLIWIATYYDAGGTMNGWFTIFIDLDTYLVQGLTQILYSLAVIELAKPGQEATIYELVETVSNAAVVVNGIISTQLLTPFDSVGCDDDTGNCPSNTVVVTSRSSFEQSDGPNRFTHYTLTLTAIAIVATLIFTPFLPASKQECLEWKKRGEVLGNSKQRGYLTSVLAMVTILYGLTAAILLLDTKTACSPLVGGSGC